MSRGSHFAVEHHKTQQGHNNQMSLPSKNASAKLRNAHKPWQFFQELVLLAGHCEMLSKTYWKVKSLVETFWRELLPTARAPLAACMLPVVWIHELETPRRWTGWCFLQKHQTWRKSCRRCWQHLFSAYSRRLCLHTIFIRSVIRWFILRHFLFLYISLLWETLEPRKGGAKCSLSDSLGIAISQFLASMYLIKLVIV